MQYFLVLIFVPSPSLCRTYDVRQDKIRPKIQKVTPDKTTPRKRPEPQPEPRPRAKNQQVKVNDQHHTTERPKNSILNTEPRRRDWYELVHDETRNNATGPRQSLSKVRQGNQSPGKERQKTSQSRQDKRNKNKTRQPQDNHNKRQPQYYQIKPDKTTTRQGNRKTRPPHDKI